MTTQDANGLALDGGNVMLYGEDGVANLPPKVSDEATTLASTDKDGGSPVPYEAASFASYRWLMLQSEALPAPAAPVLVFEKASSIPGVKSVWKVLNPNEAQMHVQYGLPGDPDTYPAFLEGFVPGRSGEQDGMALLELPVIRSEDRIQVQWHIGEASGVEEAKVPPHRSLVVNSAFGVVTDEAGDALAGESFHWHGEAVRLTGTPAGGYVFDGWSVLQRDDRTEGFPTASAVDRLFTQPLPLTLDRDLLVTAHFVPDAVDDSGAGSSGTPASTQAPSDPQVPLALTVVGEGQVLPGSGAYSLNSIVAFSIQPAEGFVFSGWTGPDGDAVDGGRLSMSGARTLTAVFAPVVDNTSDSDTMLTEDALPLSNEGASDSSVDGETASAEMPDAQAVEETGTTDGQAAAGDRPVEPILEASVPQGAPTLPKTGGMPLGLLVLAGVSMCVTGIGRRK